MVWDVMPHNLVGHISEDLHLPPKDTQISCKRSKQRWNSPYDLPWRHREGEEVKLYPSFNTSARWEWDG